MFAMTANQTIRTKFLPATNYKGSRVKAIASGGASITIPYDHSLRVHDAHLKAARALMDKMEWSGDMLFAECATGRGLIGLFTD